MKSKANFFIGMLAIVVLYILFDYYKSTVFLVSHHGLFVKLKTIVIILGGLVTMYFSLYRKEFKIFIITYLSLFIIYGVLKIMQKFFLRSGWEKTSDKFEMITQSYIYITKLFTITPFIAFFCFLWLITKVLNTKQSG